MAGTCRPSWKKDAVEGSVTIKTLFGFYGGATVAQANAVLFDGANPETWEVGGGGIHSSNNNNSYIEFTTPFLSILYIYVSYANGTQISLYEDGVKVWVSASSVRGWTTIDYKLKPGKTYKIMESYCCWSEWFVEIDGATINLHGINGATLKTITSTEDGEIDIETTDLYQLYNAFIGWKKEGSDEIYTTSIIANIGDTVDLYPVFKPVEDLGSPSQVNNNYIINRRVD